jgi:hypothetical protein
LITITIEVITNGVSSGVNEVKVSDGEKVTITQAVDTTFTPSDKLEVVKEG